MAVITDITLEYPIYIRGFKEKGNLEKTENLEKTLAYTKIWMYNYSKIYKNMQGRESSAVFSCRAKESGV